MTDTQANIRCPVCLQSFNTQERVPKIFTSCGHTICKECLTQVLKMDEPQCPLDKLTFNRNLRTADAFPTNLLGKDLIDIESLWSKCSIHDEPNKMICLTDHSLVCASCVLFGDHQGHDVKLLTDFQEIAKVKKEQLQAICIDIFKNSAQLNTSLEEKQKGMTGIIQQGFQRLHAAIDQQQSEMLQKLEKTFAEEKSILQNLMNKSSQLSLDLQNKIEEFSKFRLNPKIAQLVEEDFSSLEDTINLEHMMTLRKHTKDLSQILNIFQNALPTENLLSQVKPLAQQLTQFNEQRNSKQEEKLEDMVAFSVALNIQIQKETGSLRIDSSIKKNYYTFTKSELEEISQVSYRFWLKDEVLFNSILPVIMKLSNHLINVKEIKIDVLSDSKVKDPEMAFYSLMLASFSHPENLKSISVYAPDLSVKNIGPLYILQSVLPKVKDLETFSWNFKNTGITHGVLRALSKVAFKSMTNLQKFEINLSYNTLNENEIQEFLRTIPNVKDLRLNFSNTSLTDEALNAFSAHILPHLNQMQVFNADFNGTHITDAGVQTLMDNIPNISRIDIRLDDLKITDESLQTFFGCKLLSLSNLKHLKIHVEKTKLSNCFKQKIFDWKHCSQKIEEQRNSMFDKWNDQVEQMKHSLKISSEEDLFLQKSMTIGSSLFQSHPLFKFGSSPIQNNLFTLQIQPDRQSMRSSNFSNFSSSNTETAPSKQRAFA